MSTLTLPKPSSTEPVALQLAPPIPDAKAHFQVTCKQEDLARALVYVKGAVLERSTLPILKNILLTTDRGRLRVSATSLEIGIQVWIDAEIQVAGTTAIPAERFKKIVATLPPGKLQLLVPEGSQTLNLSCPGARTNLRSDADCKQFPVIPSIEAEEKTAILDAGQLRVMIHQVAYAADPDLEGKAMWASVKFQTTQDELILAAADTFRIAERKMTLSPESEHAEIDILVPAKNLAKLEDILPLQGKVKILVTPQKNQVIFHLEQGGEQVDFVSRLIDATYPNYQRAIPKKHLTRAVVATKALLKAIERAALFVDSRKGVVRLTFKPPEESGSLFGMVVVDADDADVGDSVSSLEAEITGPEREVFFLVEYLVQAAMRIETPQVAFEVTETGKPVLVKPVGPLAYVNLLQTKYFPKKA